MKVRWISDFFWVCEKHFRSEKMSAPESACRVHGCLTVRPRKETFLNAKEGKVLTVLLKNNDPVLAIPEEEDYCSWTRCNRNNGKKAMKRPTSMYCSDACRKAKARAAYRERNKGKK